MSQELLIGLLLLIIGAIFCFAGYRFFRILIVIWGLLFGFSLGAELASTYLGTSFLDTGLSWLVGIIVGLIFGALSYFFYTLAVVILAASVGYWLGTALAVLLNIDQSSLVTLFGLVGGILLGILTLTLKLPRLLVITLTAFGGSSAIVSGILLLTGRIPLSALEHGGVSAFISNSMFWLLAYFTLDIAGLVVQIRGVDKQVKIQY